MTQSFWKNRPVLITGATGLLGGWLAHRLCRSGADVVCLVRDWVPQREAVRSGLLEQMTVVRGDLRDQVCIERALGEYEIDTVFHLGAQTMVPVANRNPISTFESNVQGTWCLLEACRHSPMVKQIIMASSDKAYGDHDRLPYNEDMPLNGRHPYDVSKTCADLIARCYAVSFELPVAVTRCGNFYGGGDLNWNRIVPGTIRSIIFGQNPVIRSDGSFVRDYLYVEDGAAAYMLLAEKLAEFPGLRGEAFNFSNESQVTVLELVRKILHLTDKPNLRPVIRNEANNEIRHQYLSAAKAREKLGWKPLFELEEGLRKTIDWYKEYFHGE
ncbi:MAG TPA: GDP-mannose 4,6-dehydratase [Syntrophobacteraceae bacterium]|nr:GDP-mannose 4,6-dehydratase [Syntrophobacteraceae bacterium]